MTASLLWLIAGAVALTLLGFAAGWWCRWHEERRNDG